MPEKGATRLTEHCRERVGDELRSVVTYTEDGYETTYLRDDLEDRYSEEQLDRVVRVGQEIHSVRATNHTESTPLGKPGAGVRVYEHAIVLQIPVSKSAGVLATFERSVGRNLLTFLHECQRQVRE